MALLLILLMTGINHYDYQKSKNCSSDKDLVYSFGLVCMSLSHHTVQVKSSNLLDYSKRIDQHVQNDRSQLSNESDTHPLIHYHIHHLNR